MHAYDLFINEGNDWHDVEDIEKVFPNFEIISPFACIDYHIHSS